MLRLILTLALSALLAPTTWADAQTEKTRAWTQTYFERLAAADPSIKDLWADDVVLFVNNDGPWGGHYRSKKALEQYYRDMASMFDMEKPLDIELQQTVVDGTRSSIRFSVKGTHKLGPYENVYMQVYTWNEQGKMTRLENFYGWGPFAEFHKQAIEAQKK